ncbi:hypothetical protein G9A89_021837 [Geosiphon pyriformis]|nr:hypothetical protein G9A89_021837 [Geosiphon pyriformis]
MISETPGVILESLNLTLDTNRPPLLLGFFHPYCNAGGGGERVLWTAILSIQKQYKHVVCVVYTGDTDVTKSDILNKVKARFNISLKPDTLAIVHLYNRRWVEDSRYPRVTLLGQSLGSIYLGWEALSRLVPDVYFDTMGYAFTYPLVKKISGCKIAAYVHYPTISSDMLQKVQERRPSFNNQEEIARSFIYTNGKLLYYYLFAYFYGVAGSFADVIMVNSTWTKGHIDQLWRIKSRIVYPPCDTHELCRTELEGRESIIVSVAQFRPEKDHHLQIRAFHRLLIDHPNLRCEPTNIQLVLIGSSRNKEDEIRIQRLQEECKKLDIWDNVHFEINAPFSKLMDWLSRGKIGIHTMWNEHFGIGVVEYMAAGLVTVAHNSGGPKMDILVEYNGMKTGFLADETQNFASALFNILTMPAHQLKEIQVNAREHVKEKFSESVFSDSVTNLLRSLLE